MQHVCHGGKPLGVTPYPSPPCLVQVMASFKDDGSSAVIGDIALSNGSTDTSADVMEQSTLLEGKMAKKLLSQIDATRAPLYAELLKEKVNNSSSSPEKVSNSSSSSEKINMNMSMSSSSSSGPQQQPQLKRLKAHVSISSDEDSHTTPPCDFPCVACAHAGARLIPACFFLRGHYGPHHCLECLRRPNTP